MNVLGGYTPARYNMGIDAVTIYDQVYQGMEYSQTSVERFYVEYRRRCRVAYARYIMRQKRRRAQNRG